MDLSIVAILPLHLLGPNCPVLNNFLTSVAPRRILQLLYAEDLATLSLSRHCSRITIGSPRQRNICSVEFSTRITQKEASNVELEVH